MPNKVKMSRQLIRLDLRDSNLTVAIWETDGVLEVMIYARGAVSFNCEYCKDLVKALKDLTSGDLHEKESNYIDSHPFRVFMKRSPESNDFSFSITTFGTIAIGERGHAHTYENVQLGDIFQVEKLIEMLKDLREKYVYRKWLDEKIKSEEGAQVEYNGKKFEVKNGYLTLTQLGIKKISDVKGLENLKYLRGIDLSDNGIKEIKGFEHLIHLGYINLSDNNIEEIKGLEHLIHLRDIRFRNNKIKKIDGLENLNNLEYLQLSHNPISDLKELEKVAHIKYLTRIDLLGTKIPKKAFKKAGVKNQILRF